MSAIDVKLNVFEGPLDLLLHLLEKNKVNIYDIPIVTITEQYLDYVNHMEEEDLDVMSEFLVMAATLIRIKSKMLLPKVTEDDEEEEDPRDELVRRLLEYKMYKYAASELKDLELDDDQIAELVRISRHPNLYNNPVEITDEMLDEMYRYLAGK